MFCFGFIFADMNWCTIVSNNNSLNQLGDQTADEGLPLSVQRITNIVRKLYMNGINSSLAVTTANHKSILLCLNSTESTIYFSRAVLLVLDYTWHEIKASTSSSSTENLSVSDRILYLKSSETQITRHNN